MVMAGDLGETVQPNLRWDAAHGCVSQYFEEILYIIRNVDILPIIFVLLLLHFRQGNG